MTSEHRHPEFADDVLEELADHPDERVRALVDRIQVTTSTER